MGTHGAFAVTEANGDHRCIERTTDGSHLVGDIRAIGRMSPAKLSKLMYDGDFADVDVDIPPGVIMAEGGLIEEGEDREHEQAYFLHVNWQERYIGIEMATFWEVVVGRTPDEFIKEWQALIDGLPEGWTMRFEYDCPHAMEADKKRYDDEVRDDG